MGSRLGLPAIILAALTFEHLLLFVAIGLMPNDWPRGALTRLWSAAAPLRQAAYAAPARTLVYGKDHDNEALVAEGGVEVPYCSVTGCDTSGTHLLAHAYLKTTTAGRLDAQSVGAAFDFVNGRGRLGRWHPATRFSNAPQSPPPPAPPSYVVTGAEFAAKVYHNRSPDCVSSAAGSGPVGKGSALVDGTCLWDYVGDGLNSGGSGVAISTRSMAGGGSQWGLVTDSVVDSGFGDGEIVGQEFDCTNNNRDSYAGGSFGFTCLYMGGNSTYPGLAGIYLDSSAQSRSGAYGYHYGVYVSGQPRTPGSVVGEGAFVDASNARYSVWGLAGRIHSAFIEDESDSSNVLVATNAHDGIGIDLSKASFKSKIAFKAADDVVLTAGLLRPARYSVSGAPKCEPSAKGAMIVLTDLTGTPRYRSTKLSGGGSTESPAFCNGSAWELH